MMGKKTRTMFLQKLLLRGTILNGTYGTDKNLPGIYSPIFTSNIWSYLLWSPVIAAALQQLTCLRLKKRPTPNIENSRPQKSCVFQPYAVHMYDTHKCQEMGLLFSSFSYPTSDLLQYACSGPAIVRSVCHLALHADSNTYHILLQIKSGLPGAVANSRWVSRVLAHFFLPCLHRIALSTLLYCITV